MDVHPVSHQVPGRLPSPTLTNPDMILPGSPSQKESSYQSHTEDSSSLPQWHNSATEDDHDQMKLRNLFGNGHRLQHRESGKILRNHHDNIEVRPQSKQSELSQRSGNSALASSPLLHEEVRMKAFGDSQFGHLGKENWDAFDDGSVISEGVSPLVDAERETYLISENGPVEGYNFSDRFRTAIAEEEDDPYSHAAMSVRAEQILANAKRRLTEMENNLNRARHTVNRPSSSMSSFAAQDSDPVSLYTIPKNLSPSKHRQPNSPPSASSSKGHSRVFSETSVPSSMQTSPLSNGDLANEGARSSSAMASVGIDSNLDSFTKQGPESRDWFWTGLTRNTSHSIRHNYTLQPLNEDGPPPSTFDSPERQQSPPLNVDQPEVASSDQQALNRSTFEHSGLPTTGITRARSTNQMRDIRDQMQDLKGKISSLKQKAREDSLRRRSLQSMRTPSPFTAAEQWYTGAPAYQRDRSRPREGSPHAVHPVIDEEDETTQYPVQPIDSQASADSKTQSNTTTDEFPNLSGQTDGPVFRESNDSPKTVVDSSETSHEDLKDQTDVDEEVHEKEVDEQDSLYTGEQDFHESSSLPVGERHEDRPDAFDYEHFFLHSGMGTLGPGVKSRSSSHSSMYSVETTKPSTTTAETTDVNSDGVLSLDETAIRKDSADPQLNGHVRKGSIESVSTVATFATATEGKNSDEDGDEDEWVYTRPMAGSWETDHSNDRKANADRKENGQPRTKGTRHTTKVRTPPVPEISAPDMISTQATSPTDQTLPETLMPDLLAFLTPRLPSDNGVLPKTIELNGSDKELAERLVRSLAKVCAQLQISSQDGNKYEGRVWRRRLDAARRVLDGEVNGEAF